MSINTLTLKSCPKCGEALSYTDTEAYCAYSGCMWNNEECSTPAQESRSESVAAPAEVGQGLGTITLESFQRWLENQAHAARFAIEDGCDFFDRTVVHEPTIAACQLATAMVMRFKLELGA